MVSVEVESEHFEGYILFSTHVVPLTASVLFEVKMVSEFHSGKSGAVTRMMIFRMTLVNSGAVANLESIHVAAEAVLG